MDVGRQPAVLAILGPNITFVIIVSLVLEIKVESCRVSWSIFLCVAFN